jgi:hypothetical protein
VLKVNAKLASFTHRGSGAWQRVLPTEWVVEVPTVVIGLSTSSCTLAQ